MCFYNLLTSLKVIGNEWLIYYISKKNEQNFHKKKLVMKLGSRDKQTQSTTAVW